MRAASDGHEAVSQRFSTGQAARLLRNDGEAKFTDVSPAQFRGLEPNAGSWGDYDGDGDLDLFLNGSSGPAELPQGLFRTDLANGNHWLHLDLQGGPSNRSAIGARVTLVAGGKSQMRDVTGNAENYSQDSPTVEFGLGTNTVIDSVLIRWPSGTLQTLTGVSVDQRLHISESGPTNQPPVISEGLVAHDLPPRPAVADTGIPRGLSRWLVSGTPYIGTELSPVRTIAAPDQGPVHVIATSGTRALVSVGDASVALLELKDPSNPVWLGSWEPLFPPSAFALAGNPACVASYELDFLSTVEIVDFTDPTKPVLKGSQRRGWQR